MKGEAMDTAQLDRAIDYFRRVKAPLTEMPTHKFVFRAHGGAWVLVSREQLIEWIESGEDTPAAERRATWKTLPLWWSLEQPYALRRADGTIVGQYRSRGEAVRAQMQLSNFTLIVTADLETGAEVTAE